jgi:hypothetical protein
MSLSYSPATNEFQLNIINILYWTIIILHDYKQFETLPYYGTTTMQYIKLTLGSISDYSTFVID